MARNSCASFGASASALGRSCGPSSASTFTKTVPSPPTRLTISWISRTEGRSEGSNSWKLDRISSPDASQTETAATTEAPARVRNGCAIVALVTRATRSNPGFFTRRDYHTGPASEPFFATRAAHTGRRRGGDRDRPFAAYFPCADPGPRAQFRAPDAPPANRPRCNRRHLRLPAGARAALRLRSRRDRAPPRRVVGQPGT